jgi:hypothetical protein
MESEYRSAVIGQDYRPNDSQALSTLNRKINATYKIAEMFREGLLDQVPLKDPMNLLLLEESETTLREAGNVAAIWGGWSKNEDMLAKMAIKYQIGEPIVMGNAGQAPPTEVTRRTVLIAMLARLRTNFSQLMSQIAVKKQ